MRVWLVQRSEPTPHDDDGKCRLYRMGLLAKLLQERGHEVVWWTSTFDHSHLKKRFENSVRLKVTDNYEIQYLKSYGYKKNKSLSRIVDQKWVAKEFSKLTECEEKKPDIILATMPTIDLALASIKYGKSHGIPVLIDIRDLWPDVFRDLMPKYLRWLVDLAVIPMRFGLKKACREATAITGITQEFVEWGISYSGRDKTDNDIHFPMAYIKHPNTKEELSLAFDFWKKLGINKDDDIINLLFLGTFISGYEFSTLFEAAEILQKNGVKVRFIFCGLGPQEQYIRKQCSKLDNCILAGWVDAPKIEAALKLSDIGLAPYKELDNFIFNIPNKPPEYMSERLVIATSLTKGKLFDLLQDNDCGFSYGADSNKLVDMLTVYANDKIRLQRNKNSARNVYENYFNGINVYENMINYLEGFMN